MTRTKDSTLSDQMRQVQHSSIHEVATTCFNCEQLGYRGRGN